MVSLEVHLTIYLYCCPSSFVLTSLKILRFYNKNTILILSSGKTQFMLAFEYFVEISFSWTLYSHHHKSLLLGTKLKPAWPNKNSFAPFGNNIWSIMLFTFHFWLYTFYSSASALRVHISIFLCTFCLDGKKLETMGLWVVFPTL